MQRKVSKIIVISVIALLIAGAIIALSPVFTGQQGYRTVSVIEVSGRVSVVKGDIEYSAYPGMVLQEGHEVITSGDSYVRLVLDQDKYVKLEEGSRLVFETLGVLGSGKTALVLERGALTTELVSPLGEGEQYVINTPNAIFAVRGTFFRVDLRRGQNGDIISDINTYGGRVASKRIFPSGEVVEEDVLIEAGYKACVNMTKDYTYYVVETTNLIDMENISNQDMVDLYFSAENGHELFVTTEELQEIMDSRGIDLQDQISVYEKAEKVWEMQKAASSEMVNVPDYIDDNRPLAEEGSEEIYIYEDEIKQESMLITDGAAHVHEIARFSVEATCLEPGGTTAKCRTCKEVIEETVTLPHGHSFGEWVVLAEATCNAVGERQSSCNICGETVNESVEALGHDYGDDFVVDTEATCVAGGSMSKHCSRCNSISEVTAVPGVGHVYGEWKVEQAATCVVDGKKTRSCNRCGTTEEESIPMSGHVYGQVQVIQTASCTSAGKQQKVCGICKNTVQETIAAKGHSFSDWNVTQEETCIDVGFRERICDVCEYKEETLIEALGHSYGEWNVTLEATCTSTGSRVRVCALCQEEERETLAVLEHDYEEEYTVDIPPTCTMTGTKTRHCSKCGDYTDKVPIEALGHDFGETYTVDQEATCTEAGSMSKHCSRCEVTDDVTEIEAIGHIYAEEFSIDQEATCTVDGSKSKHCTREECEATSETTVIPAGHSYSEWDVIEEATCTEDGLQKKACKGCGDIVEEILTALGHKDEDGDSICDNCSEAYVTISAGNFPDSVFRVYVEGYDLNQDTYLTEDELKAVDTMDLNGSSLADGGMSDLTGIEYFTELTHFTCSYNAGLTELDLEKNTKLQELRCDNTGLTTLDVSASDELTFLDISNTAVQNARDISVSTSAELTELYMDNTNIAFENYGDAPWLGNLEIFHADKASFKNVEWNDVVKRTLSPSLREMKITNNDSNSNPDEYISMDMDLSKFGSLEYLDLSHNADMSGLSLDASSTLKMLNIAGTGIQELNVDSYSVLDSLTISNEAGTCAQLRTIDVDKCTSLETLDVSGCSALSELNAMDCTGLVTLDITGCTGLKTMELGGCTVLSDLDVAGHTGLEVLNVGYCEALTELDVSGCSSLYMLANEACNNVTSMNLDGTSLSSFYNLYCNLTELQEISAKNANLNGTDMATMTRMLSSKLERLDVEGNIIEYVDFGGKDVSNLKYLNLANNAELTQVSLSSCSGLEELNLSGTGVDYLTLSDSSTLKKLNVADCTNLTGISVDGCSSLTELNLTNCNALQQLDVSGSGLEVLELNNMSNLNRLTLNRSGMTNTVMKELSLMDLGITSLEIAGMSNLQKVQVSGDFLSMVTITDSSIKSELIMSDSPELIALITTNAYIKRIEATGCSLLSEFRVPGSGAEEVTFVDCPNLQIVDVSSSAITTLRLPGSEYPYLAILNVSYCNALTTVELQGGTALVELDVLSCPVLASINLSGCTGQLSIDVRGVNGSDDVPAELEVNVSDTYLTENNFTKSANLTLKLITN